MIEKFNTGKKSRQFGVNLGNALRALLQRIGRAPRRFFPTAYKSLYMQGKYETEEKEIRWIGSSYDELLAFSQEPRKKAGFQLGKVQAGLDPEDWKPFDDVGPGTKEIRIKDSQGIYRVMFVAKFEEVAYLLHCFLKKTKTTTQHDKGIAEARYRAFMQERKVKK